jgi:hypothetical protein
MCEWPVAEIPETRNEIDSALVRDAAAEAVILWSDIETRSDSGGWATYAAQRVLPASPPGEPPEPGHPDTPT